MRSLDSNLLPERWSRVAERLKPALKDYVHEAKTQVEQGREHVYRVGDTVTLLRAEHLENGDHELVVVALDGEMRLGTVSVVNHAIANGFDSIRAHFFRPGAERFIRRQLKLPVHEIERRGDERVLRIKVADMGGRSSSSSQRSNLTQTTNTSGSTAASGDNLGVMLAGVNDSDINLSVTDHGALAVAGELADEAFQFGDSTVTTSLNVIKSTVQDALTFGSSALEEMQTVNAQQSAATQAALSMAKQAKAREQEGMGESNLSLLKQVSLIVGITGTVVTVAVLLWGRNR